MMMIIFSGLEKISVKWCLKYDVMLVMDDHGQCEFLPSRKPLQVNTCHELRQRICYNTKLFATVLQMFCRFFANLFITSWPNLLMSNGLLYYVDDVCLSLCVLGSVGISTHSCDATKLFLLSSQIA